MDETRAILRVTELIRPDGTSLYAYKYGGFVGTASPSDNVIVVDTIYGDSVNRIAHKLPQNKPRKHRKRALLGLE